MSTENNLAAVSIVVSLIGIAAVVVERVHHGWFPF